MEESFIVQIRMAALKQLLFLPHAIKQMSHPKRMITSDEVLEVIQKGEIIEEYKNDPRGQSALLLGKSNNRAIHAVVAPKEDYLAIITAYLPSTEFWELGFRKRRTSL